MGKEGYKMKKHILSLAAISCLILSMTACGGGNASSSASSSTSSAQTSVQTSSESSAEVSSEVSSGETANSDLPSLEDYFNSNIMQTVISATKEQYASQGISSDMYAEGDELHYDFTLSDIETTEEDRAALSESLKSSMEANADAFLNTAVQAKAAVSNENVVVVVSYFDGAGNELYSQSFSSADAE